jgi:hypothetical protein
LIASLVHKRRLVEGAQDLGEGSLKLDGGYGGNDIKFSIRAAAAVDLRRAVNGG